MIHLSRSDETVALDYREVAPKNACPEMFQLDERGEVKDKANAIGPLAIAVPGVASGIATMVERYGTMKLRGICKFARDQAAKGTLTSPAIRLIIRENRDSSLQKFRRFKPTGEAFLKTTKPVQIRRTFSIPNLARTLDTIVREGMQSLHHGRLANEIVTYLRSKGAILKLEDLEDYSPKIRTPVTGTYRDVEICSIPPPSSGGLAIIETLNIVEGFDLSAMKHNSPETIHTIAEAMKLGYVDRCTYIADPDFVSVPTSKLCSKEHSDRLRSMIDQTSIGSDAFTDLSHGSNTSHLNVMDKEGNVVALTESIECYFGSGILIPEVGLLMNDEMHDFDPEPGRLNSVEPKKRPLSSMGPTILFKDDRPYVALGGAGGPRIISSVVQTILNIVEFGMTLDQAVAAPRFHCQRDKVTVENGIRYNTLKALMTIGHRIETKPRNDLFFGGVQAAMSDSAQGVYLGTADPRRDGIALAF